MKHRGREKLDVFAQAFAPSLGGCRRTCRCGREFYNPDGGWSWEDGELAELQKAGATALPYTVTVVEFEGAEYVQDCDCWHPRAEQIIAWIDAHAHQIAGYLNAEKRRKAEDARRAPSVDTDDRPAR